MTTVPDISVNFRGRYFPSFWPSATKARICLSVLFLHGFHFEGRESFEAEYSFLTVSHTAAPISLSGPLAFFSDLPALSALSLLFYDANPISRCRGFEVFVPAVGSVHMVDLGSFVLGRTISGYRRLFGKTEEEN